MKRIFAGLLLAILLAMVGAVPIWAALPNYTAVWEVETGGNDTNGGGFDSAGTGTDMSQFPNKNATSCTSCQSATANLSKTDGVCAGTTTFVSATAAFTSAISGNFIYLTGGTGSLTAVWKEATFVNSTTVTLDSSCATGTGITVNIGGALATPAQASANMLLSTAAAVWVKSGTYSIAATIHLANGATNNGIPVFAGYNATRGDLNFANCLTATCPVFQAAAGLAGADNAVLEPQGPSGMVTANLTIDCNNQTFTVGVLTASPYQSLRNIYAKNCSDPAFYIANVGEHGDQLTSTNSPAAGITGGHPTVSAMHIIGGDWVQLYNVALLGSTVANAMGLNGACGGNYTNMVISGFTGTTADAVVCATLEEPTEFNNFSIYNITRDAFRFTFSSAIDSRPVLVRNAVISDIGGYGFDQTGTQTITAGMGLSDHNFFDSVTGSPLGFYHNWPAGVGDTALSVIPFTAPGSNDFSLNSTTGGGASVKGAGFPGVASFGTGHIDGGALQSAGGSSSVTVGTPIVQ